MIYRGNRAKTGPTGSTTKPQKPSTKNARRDDKKTGTKKANTEDKTTDTWSGTIPPSFKVHISHRIDSQVLRKVAHDTQGTGTKHGEKDSTPKTEQTPRKPKQTKRSKESGRA